MKAVYKHELTTYFTSMPAYIFISFLLLFAGIFMTLINISSAVSNFEYVLANMSFTFMIIVPILTMRVISNEKRQKTDNLLYSLPITMTDVVLGKYFALLTVFVIPTVIMGIYPLILNHFGDVNLGTSYCALLGFFLLGCALIAVGMFISSLTESQAASAGICFAVMLFNYFSSVVASRMKAGFVSNLLSRLSLFDCFDGMIYGVFDICGIVFFLSVAGVFVFLTIRHMDNRRWAQ